MSIIAKTTIGNKQQQMEFYSLPWSKFIIIFPSHSMLYYNWVFKIA